MSPRAIRRPEDPVAVDGERASPRAPEDWRLTIRRAEALVRRRDPAALGLLFPALRWRHETARGEAVRLLAAFGEAAVPRLLRTLESAETAVERRAAADALGRMDAKAEVRALIRALDDPNMVVRRAAAVALLRIRATEAVGPIARLLRDESGGVRVLAAEVLGEFRDRRAVSALLAALRDEKGYVRGAAATALGKIRDVRAMRELLRAKRDPSPSVAEAARRSVESLIGAR